MVREEAELRVWGPTPTPYLCFLHPLRPSLFKVSLTDAPPDPTSPAPELGPQSPGSGLGWVLLSPVVLLFLS